MYIYIYIRIYNIWVHIIHITYEYTIVFKIDNNEKKKRHPFKWLYTIIVPKTKKSS